MSSTRSTTRDFFEQAAKATMAHSGWYHVHFLFWPWRSDGGLFPRRNSPIFSGTLHVRNWHLDLPSAATSTANLFSPMDPAHLPPSRPSACWRVRPCCFGMATGAASAEIFRKALPSSRSSLTSRALWARRRFGLAVAGSGSKRALRAGSLVLLSSDMPLRGLLFVLMERRRGAAFSVGGALREGAARRCAVPLRLCVRGGCEKRG
mmetsp:Transcript_19868/g.52025  ORF Transcript_19868/g.52025 Transcript_19868/m.52025 type:complete len:206 (-) Transcript_19868:9-626(-)